MTECLPDELPASPMPVVEQWLQKAVAASATPNPNAFVLSTAALNGTMAAPSSRVVLCKEFRCVPGYLVFYTNYSSRKARELDDQPRAAANFFWDASGHQARITGPVLKSPPAESDAYFASRSWRSKLGAWASEQSAPVASRQAMFERVRAAWRAHGVDYPHGNGDTATIERPDGWGGFRLWAETVELWVNGDARVHDRALWTRQLAPSGDAFDAGPWRSTRLQP